MKPDALDQNLERLLRIAPPRARLSDVERARIRRALGESYHPKPVPRLRILPLMAAAAAVLLVSFGVWRWGQRTSTGTAPSEPSDQIAAGPERISDDPLATDDATGAGEPGPLDPTVELAERESVATMEREPDPIGPAGNASAAGAGAGSAPEPDPSGAATGESDVVAKVIAEGLTHQDESEWPLNLDIALPATLWVKPVVQLPLVADPEAHEVELRFSPARDITETALAYEADFTLKNALSAAAAMGSDQVQIQVEAPGFAPASARVSTDEAAAGELRFGLIRGVPVYGQVVDAEDGQPIPGAVVVAIDQLPLDALDVAVDPRKERLPKPYVLADSLGQFQLEHVAPAGRLRVRASAPGFAPTVAVVNDAATTEEGRLTIELTRGSSLTGLVERPDGSSWEGALVVVSMQEVDPANTERPVMTFGAGVCDARGEFRVTGLPAGQYVVLLFDPDRPRSPREFRQVRLDGSKESRVDFRAPVAVTGLALEAVLVDTEGLPVPGASITLSGLDEGANATSDWRVTETDAGGTFQFSGLQPSGYAMHLSTDGFGKMQLIWEGRIDSSQQLRVVLSETGVRLTGRGADGDEPSWIIFDRWRDQTSEWYFAGRTQTELNQEDEGTGRVGHLEHLVPGRYRAVFLGPGHGASWAAPFEVEVGRGTNTNVELRPGGPLALRAIDAATGNPIEGLVVIVEDPEGRKVPQQDTVRTGPEGRAVTLSVPHGRVKVRLRNDGSSDAPGGPRAVLWEKTLDFDATLDPLECLVEVP